MTDFLGTGAPFWSDVNLIVELAMGGALLVGMMLARAGRFRAHCYCQSSVVLLNLVLIATIMLPSFHGSVQPQLAHPFGNSYVTITLIHASIGATAQVLGIYIILAAATNLLPERIRFQNFKPWMRTELGLWWVVVLLGVSVYYVWYVRAQAPIVSSLGAHGATVHNFAFAPKVIKVRVGSTVQWQVTQGQHTVTADNGAFGSAPLTPGSRFKFTFHHPGTFLYHCRFHGAPGGVGMSGRIVVTP